MNFRVFTDFQPGVADVVRIVAFVRVYNPRVLEFHQTVEIGLWDPDNHWREDGWSSK